MKISVIVPVYNVQDFLAECIESVLQQTYQNFELILVDDGANDTSGDICDRYAAIYSQQIKVIHTINGGAFRARIIGIQEACGDYCVFLDSDDCLRKDALEKLSACFKHNMCDMVLFDAGECLEFASRKVYHNLKAGQIFEKETKKQLYHKIICGQIPNSVCLKAVKSECVRISTHFSQYRAKYGEDLLMSVHLITQCEKIVYLNEALYYYRNRPGSAVNSISVPVINDSVKNVHTELEKYIDQWGMPELKPLHSARKVKGWVYNLAVLQNGQKLMPRYTYKEMVQSMAKDPYFTCAYKSMDVSRLSYYERSIAWCLYHKQYYALTLLHRLKNNKTIQILYKQWTQGVI